MITTLLKTPFWLLLYTSSVLLILVVTLCSIIHQLTMTCTSISSPMRSPRLFRKYLKPGALAKLRDSKIKTRRNKKTAQFSFSEVLLTPTSSSSPIQDDHPPNLDTGVACFTSHINLNCPSYLCRKKLFAISPILSTHTHQF